MVKVKVKINMVLQFERIIEVDDGRESDYDRLNEYVDEYIARDFLMSDYAEYETIKEK